MMTAAAPAPGPGPDARPSWVDALLPRPAIEVRRGLSFDNDPPAEKSSVLALTAPSGKFVDLRYALDPGRPSPLPSPLGFPGYATAGLCEYRVLVGGADGCPPYDCAAYVTWRHDLESSCGFGTDGADMYLLGNGDVMEVGTMEWEGRVKLFKEYWTKPRPDVETLPCVVAEAEGGEKGRRGVVIRVGDYCQGIVQSEDEFLADRLERNARGEWVRDGLVDTKGRRHESSVGKPCAWVTEDARQLGETYDADGLVWKVTEVVRR